MMPFGQLTGISVSDEETISMRSMLMILVSSGPLYFVSAKASSNSGTVVKLPVVVIIVHMLSLLTSLRT